ncbi:MAG TPA: DUF501 domain-containing protein [Coriobacteriia bacterium]|nr:DUF501 domain-containing protein [Coriobacteriia bacterium]
MSPESHNDAETLLAQIGRAPRPPWRVFARCEAGFPQAIVSPSELADGTPFPNYAWLTCPWLVEECSAEESGGATAAWATRAAEDVELADSLIALDAAVRAARASESGGFDLCEGVGVAGQRSPLGVKCLHAHVALALVGLCDPIGSDVLSRTGTMCSDTRCARLVPRCAQTGKDE